MVSSTARKAAKQWDNREQHTTCYSTQALETRNKKNRAGARAKVQLQVEASGCREEPRGCRRLAGTDEKNPSEMEGKQVPIHLPCGVILLLTSKNNSVLL